MTSVLVLGAGFGGLELTSRLAAEFGGRVDIVLIDQSDSFVFGFSKLDVMFGRQPAAAVRHFYRDIAKPGVRFVQSTIRMIDPVRRRVETDAGRSRPTSWSWRSARTCTRTPPPGWWMAATSSTPRTARSHSAMSWTSSRAAGSSSRSRPRRSSARPHRARPRSCCTTTYGRAAATVPTSPGHAVGYADPAIAGRL